MLYTEQTGENGLAGFKLDFIKKHLLKELRIDQKKKDMEFKEWRNITKEEAQSKILSKLQILDIGCGSGYLAKGLSNWGIGKVEGIDWQSKCIDQANSSINEN